MSESSSSEPAEAFDRPLVVGVGAPPGSGEALHELLGAVPPDSGLVLVITGGLLDEEPALQDMLDRSAIAVEVAPQTVRLAPDGAYLLDPRACAWAVDTHLRVATVARPPHPGRPIDRLFETLARSCRSRSVGILLDGPGSDGITGARAMKSSGGVVIAQSAPREKSEGVSALASAAGVVDASLPPARIPLEALRMGRRRPPSAPDAGETERPTLRADGSGITVPARQHPGWPSVPLDRYRTVLAAMGQGFCIVEVLFDEGGRAADYRFLEANSAFVEQTGLRGAVGRRMLDLEPEHEPHWFAAYGRVALTGEPARFVQEAKQLGGRWFEVQAFRIGEPQERRVAILFTDITERRAAEEALRRSEARLSQELATTRMLHELALETGEAGSPEVEDTLSRVLATALGIQGADSGNVQLLSPSGTTLELVAQTGSPSEFLERFSTVDVDANTTCARAIRSRERVVIADVHDSPSTPDRDAVVLMGCRAVHSTPLLSRSGEPLGVLSTYFKEPRPQSERDERTLDLLARQAADLIDRSRAKSRLQALTETLEERVEEQTQRVSELISRLSMAEQEERHRIAGVLHDDLQQLLYAIEMKLEQMQVADGVSEQPELAKDLRRAADWVNRAIETTRSLTTRLNPPALAEGHLGSALEWLSEQMRDLHGIEVDLDLKALEEPPAREIRMLLYQIARELLFNVKKHAGVEEAAVRLAGEGDELVLQVEDEGRGFEPDEVEGSRPGAGGFGLASVRDRLELVGGHLDIRSEPGGGTRVTVRAPCRSLLGGQTEFP